MEGGRHDFRVRPTLSERMKFNLAPGCSSLPGNVDGFGMCGQSKSGGQGRSRDLWQVNFGTLGRGFETDETMCDGKREYRKVFGSWFGSRGDGLQESGMAEHGTRYSKANRDEMLKRSRACWDLRWSLSDDDGIRLMDL